MAKKALLKFHPLDLAYCAVYGIMPDYDFTNRLKAGASAEEAGALINGRLEALWAQQKYDHEHPEERMERELEEECPF